MADEGLTAGAVARRLGVAVTTLRTWHQRYGLGPSEHVPGHHRRYTTEDLDRLEVMRRLTTQGIAPSEAAAWARRTPPTGAPEFAFLSGAGPVDGGPRGSVPDGDGPGGAVAADDGLGGEGADDDRLGGEGADSDGLGGGAPPGGGPSGRALAGGGPSGRALAGGGPRGRAPAGGGNTIALGPATPAARGLARAAMRLDATSMRDILEMVVAQHGVIGAWNDVMMPVLIGIGERYHATKRFIEVEHLFSRAVTEVLGAIPRPGDNPRVLLAAADEEQHTLPLEALAAALAEASVPARLLGARVPPPALAEAIARTGPAVVVLWSQLPSTGDPSQLIRISEAPRRPLMIAAAGPGWPGHLPAVVVRLSALDQAVETIRVAADPG